MKTILALLICIIAVLSTSPSALADIILHITEVDGDVLVDGSGAFDLTGLTSANTSAFVRVKPNEFALVGPPATTPIDFYQGVLDGPSSIGFGSVSWPATMGAGDLFGLHFAGNIGLAVPDGYISETELYGNSKYAGQTLSSLGLSAGTYSWAFGNDKVEVIVIAVPEPTSLLLAILALTVAARFRLRP